MTEIDQNEPVEHGNLSAVQNLTWMPFAAKLKFTVIIHLILSATGLAFFSEGQNIANLLQRIGFTEILIGFALSIITPLLITAPMLLFFSVRSYYFSKRNLNDYSFSLKVDKTHHHSQSYRLIYRYNNLTENSGKIVNLLASDLDSVYYFHGVASDCPRVYGYGKHPVIVLCFPHYSKYFRVPCGTTPDKFESWKNFLSDQGVKRVSRPYNMSDFTTLIISFLLTTALIFSLLPYIIGVASDLPMDFKLLIMLAIFAFLNLLHAGVRSFLGEFPFLALPKPLIRITPLMVTLFTLLAIFFDISKNGQQATISIAKLNSVRTTFIYSFAIFTALFSIFSIGYLCNRQRLNSYLKKACPLIFLYEKEPTLK